MPQQASWLEHNFHWNAQELHVPNLLPRWCHSSFNFCRLIPDVIWNFPYFSLLCPPNSNIPVSLTFACCLVSFMYQLCPSSPVGSWFHTAHSSIPRPCHSDCIFSLTLSTLPQISQPWILLSYIYSQSQGLSSRGKSQLRGLEGSK